MTERTTDEWLELFVELEIPAAPLNTPDALFDNEHLNAVGLFETVRHPARAGAVARCADLVLPHARPGRGPGARAGRRHRERARRTGLAEPTSPSAVGSG